MSLTDYFSAVGTAASSLMLSFIGGFTPSIAARAGTKRRLARERAANERRATFYAGTPNDDVLSRQRRRHQGRQLAKKEAHQRNNPRHGKRPKPSQRSAWRSIWAEAKKMAADA